MEIDATGSVTAAPETRVSRLTSPALFLALAFALGIAFTGAGRVVPQDLFRTIPVLSIAAAMSLFAGAALVRAQREALAAIATLAGFVFAGVLASLLFSFRFPPDHVSRLANWGIDPGRPVRVEGTLTTDCVPDPSGCEFDLALAAVLQDRASGQTKQASGKIRVQVQASRAGENNAGAAFALRSGDHVRATMNLRQPHAFLNPGSFDFRERAANIDDLYWEGSIENPSDLNRLLAGRAAGTPLIQRVRARLRAAIDRLYPPWSTEGRDGAVLKAILLGDRTSLDSSTIDRFRASGLYHLLVIAGLHVGLIAGMVLGLLRLIGIRRGWRNSMLLGVLLAYAVVVEQRAPTLRATLTIIIFLLAQFLGRDHSALNAVGLAALIILVTRPAWLFESGFQLSFAAALLIVGLAAPVLRMTLEPYRNALRHLEDVERDTALLPRQAQLRVDLRLLVSVLRRSSPLLDRHPGVVRRFVVWPLQLALWIAGMVLFSAVLQIGLLLPMVEQFHRVTLAGIGLNAVALPLMGIVLAIAIPTVLLALVAPVVAIWPAKALAGVFQALFAVAEWPHLPVWLSYRVPSPPPWVAAGFVISLVALAESLRRNRFAARASLACFAIVVLLLITAPFPPRLENGSLGVTALDCGGGEAVFITLPDRSTVLIGAGGTGRASPAQFTAAKRWDPGENIVSPYLWSRQIKNLDLVVVTSVAGNLDGFASVIQNFRAGELWFRDADTGVSPILEEAARRRIAVRVISPGESLRLGGTIFEILARSEEKPEVPTGPKPLIVRVTSVQARALVTGGTLDDVQRQILKSSATLSAIIVATGRRTLVWTASSNLRAPAERPSNNDPPPASGDPYDTAASSPIPGIGRTFLTDRDGAITVEMRGGSAQVSAFR